MKVLNIYQNHSNYIHLFNNCIFIVNITINVALTQSDNKLTDRGGRIILETAAKFGLKGEVNSPSIIEWRGLKLDDSAVPTEWRGLYLDGIRQFIAATNKQSSLNKQQKLLILGKKKHEKTSFFHYFQENKSIEPIIESTNEIDIS